MISMSSDDAAHSLAPKTRSVGSIAIRNQTNRTHKPMIRFPSLHYAAARGTRLIVDRLAR
jgi:hypothetical protein